MTREEQIYSAAINDCDLYGEDNHFQFTRGAKWADEHPQFSKEEFIEKACEWLVRYASDYAFSIYDEDDACSVDDRLIEDFKRAMLEE